MVADPKIYHPHEKGCNLNYKKFNQRSKRRCSLFFLAEILEKCPHGIGAESSRKKKKHSRPLQMTHGIPQSTTGNILIRRYLKILLQLANEALNPRLARKNGNHGCIDNSRICYTLLHPTTISQW